jgi:hypothetical protein
MLIVNRYDTPHSVHSVASYAIKSPNGSTVLIYGNATGIRIIWQGGRPFKPSSSEPQAKPNGGQEDAVMILDSDDEQTGSQNAAFEDNAEFEEQEEETEAGNSYPNIVQHLDLDLGAAGLHIAVPQILPGKSASGSGLQPPILDSLIVLAVACSDSTIRVISFPSIPPSPASKSRPIVHSSVIAARPGSGKWGESVISLPTGTIPCDSVAITFVAAEYNNAATSHDKRGETKTNESNDWHVLVASCSRAGRGQMLLHRVPIIVQTTNDKPAYTLSTDIAEQRQHLSSPAVKVSFHPDISSLSHYVRLLVVEKSACRIFDCGNLTTQHGAWLLSLYPGFQKDDTSSFSTSAIARKSIVDCEWAMSGKAIITLLGDGEWGIWDIEGATSTGSKGLLARQSIMGGSLTAFSLSGWLDGQMSKSSTGRQSSITTSSKFAPMTPSTRKVAEPVLFSGRHSVSAMNGGISVARLPPTSSTSAAEESVVFWLQDSYYLIPNLRAYYEAQARRTTSGGSGSLFGAGSPAGRLIRIEDVNFRGERCCSITSRAERTSSKTSIEIVLAAEHRYLVVPMVTSQLTSSDRSITLQRSSSALEAGSALNGLDAIDDALNRMSNGHSSLLMS